MADYEHLYHVMFNAATDALERLKSGHAQQAIWILEKAQTRAEDEYLSEEAGNTQEG